MKNKKIGMVFPGQGIQYKGMMSGFSIKNIIIKNTFEEASDILKYDLWKLIKFNQFNELNNTWNTQPAILTSSLAIFRLWLNEKGDYPALIAGHSLGEYTALVCSEVINFCSAINLVKIRGKLMHEASPSQDIGIMKVIIGLDNKFVIRACKEATKENSIVMPSNFNAPKQITITGHKDAVERASLICKKMNAKLIIDLPINIPSHCPLMIPAAKKFKQEIEKIKFHTPKISFINNVDAKIEQNISSIKNALIRQLYNPVLWTNTIQLMFKNNINIIFEIGPNNVLTNLSKRINKKIQSYSINNQNILLKINKMYKEKK